ncbi:MAG TPA: hypothetical protein VF739_08570 [Ktedonobacterales bacterium]
MGFFDTLFGRQKPTPAGDDKIFAMSTAQITLQTEQNLIPTGSAAMCFKGIASGPFSEIQTNLEQLLELASREDHLTIKPSEDTFGYRWFTFTSSDFQALVTAIHMASSTLLDRGYGSQLLFAIFAFKRDNGQEMYWLYNYKRSTFYPFVPQRDANDPARARNNPEELRMSAALGKEMPIEPELDRWFAVWNPPL